MSSLDLTRFLPPRYRDKAIDTLLKSAFNRHLSKEDSIPLFGYVGDRNNLLANDVKITERDMERQLNQLVPLIRAEHGTEKKVFSWQDLVQKLQLLGVDYDSIGDWFKSKSYNFAPPIDLDKFCNFNQYFWAGPWQEAGADLNDLGVPTNTYVDDAFEDSANPDYLPEYYVIVRGRLTDTGGPHPILPGSGSPWSDWSYVNLWIHRDDAIAYAEAHPLYSINDLPQAIRPILEYDRVKLNHYQDSNGAPADAGTFNPGKKYRRNQPPMFDLYENDGTPGGRHTGLTSSIFYYLESPDAPLDETMNRRLVTKNGDFMFSHSLVQDGGSLLFYKFLDPSYDLSVDPTTFNIGGADVTILTRLDYEFSINPTTYSLTGISTTLAKIVLYELDPATYSLSGVAATLRKIAELDLNTTTYSLTGASTTLTKTQTVYEAQQETVGVASVSVFVASTTTLDSNGLGISAKLHPATALVEARSLLSSPTNHVQNYFAEDYVDQLYSGTTY